MSDTNKTKAEIVDEQKLAIAAKLLKAPIDQVKDILFARSLATIPIRYRPRYLLPDLDIVSCDRLGDNLVRIELASGRKYFGQRSEKMQYSLYQTLRSRLPKKVTADGYKLAIDIQTRYFETVAPWYFGPEGTYVEGGCFTGLKAIKWSDMLGPKSRVIAVEIGESNYDLMKLNVGQNGLSGRVTPVHAGLWRENGPGVQKHSFGSKRFLETTDLWDSSMVIEEPTRMVTVDALLDEHEVDVAQYLNIQVNGAEIEVMKGFRNLDRAKVLNIAACYTKSAVRNVDVVEELLVSRGCQVLEKSLVGRIALATPKYVDEIMAMKPEGYTPPWLRKGRRAAMAATEVDASGDDE